MLLKGIRQDILDTSQKLMEEGLIVSGQGNLSCYDRDQGYIAITPSGVPYDQRQADDICVIDIDEHLIHGNWQPTSEIKLHMVYYRNRQDVSAVIHTHAPYATVYGILGKESMPMVLNEAAMGLGGPVPVAPYERPGTEALARLTFEKTGQGVAAIMAHHGLVAVGPSLQDAYLATLAAEHTARALILARSLGLEPSRLPAEEVDALREMYLDYGASPADPAPEEN